MKVHGVAYRSIWPIERRAVGIIDQTLLPYEFCPVEVNDWRCLASAISSMQLRGAPLIGVAAAYGIALAMNQNCDDDALDQACRQLLASRPTGVNLRWAVQRMRARLTPLARSERARAAWQEADTIAEEDVAMNRSIGCYGSALLAQTRRRGTAARVGRRNATA